MSATGATIDRRLLVATSATLNGIDFVEVAASRVELSVHFLGSVSLAGTMGTPPATITGGETVSAVTVLPVDDATAWSADSEGRPVLKLRVAAPGDFSTYTLRLDSPRLDSFFAEATFRFGGAAEPALDCRTPAQPCPVADLPAVAIDYLAKDFRSFRQALSEFSVLRYPRWVERSEADLGVVLMEALAALGDELSYLQDRVLGESTLATATQRLSATAHARLVDYEPTPATVASTLLQLDVAAGPDGTGWVLDAPLRCAALGADDGVVEFEVEDPTTGFVDGVGVPAWASLDTRWNRGHLQPYVWDGSTRCLRAGASELYLSGTGLGLRAGQRLLLDTPAGDSADPPTRELVTVAAASETSDALREVALTYVALAAPTVSDHDLTATVVAGNLVPAVQGARRSERFTIPAPDDPSGPVVVRHRPGSSPADPLPEYRYCLTENPLAWIATGESIEYSATPARPEIALRQLPPPGGASEPEAWRYVRWLLDAGPADLVFTLTPERYAPVLAAAGRTWFDYDGDAGTTIRFGGGMFGSSPLPGTTFEVVYRVGAGATGNVPADTVVSVAPGQPQGDRVTACTNPFAATGGADAETLAQVRRHAPERFRAQLLRAVQLSDYSAAAGSLQWVQQAGTTFRWTGSWLTVVTSADPTAREDPSAAELESLTSLLDRRRLAGYESYVVPPRYISLDLAIVVVGHSTAFASDVEQAVLTRLLPGRLADGSLGFFDHGRWSFGQPLEVSALLSAIAACPGVAGVAGIEYQRRGIDAVPVPLTESLAVAGDQIVRIDNDPSRPEAGSLRVSVTGSK